MAVQPALPSNSTERLEVVDPYGVSFYKVLTMVDFTSVLADYISPDSPRGNPSVSLQPIDSTVIQDNGTLKQQFWY